MPEIATATAYTAAEIEGLARVEIPTVDEWPTVTWSIAILKKGEPAGTDPNTFKDKYHQVVFMKMYDDYSFLYWKLYKIS